MPGEYDSYAPWELPEIDRSLSLTQCISQAEAGDANAQIELALRYFDGKGVNQDKEKAIEFARQSAKQGNAKALYFLAYMEYLSGNPEQELNYLRLSADKEFALAQNRMGIIMYSEGDTSQSYQWHLRAAKNGFAQSCYECGAFLLAGDGVKQDLKEAVRWLRIAAEAGIMRAQFELGVCYAQGEGVEQSYEECFKWISKSAEKDHPRSLCIIGEFYLNGVVVERNFEKGCQYLIRAASLGSKEAQAMLLKIQKLNGKNGY